MPRPSLTNALPGEELSRCSWLFAGDRCDEGHDRRLKKLLRLSMAPGPPAQARAGFRG